MSTKLQSSPHMTRLEFRIIASLAAILTFMFFYDSGMEVAKWFYGMGR